MPTTNTKRIATLLAATFLLGVSPMLGTAPALAYDDDVDVVCTENNAGETICEEVADLKVECPLSDPEGTGELCGGLDESRPGRGLGKVADGRAARHFRLINQSNENDDTAPTARHKTLTPSPNQKSNP